MTTPIGIGNTVTTPSGGIGVVTSIDQRTRSHFVRRLYHVRLDDGSLESFEEIVVRDEVGKKLAKPLTLEQVTEAKLAKPDPTVKAKPETPVKPVEA